jgi:hypothetical protein
MLHIAPRRQTEQAFVFALVVGFIGVLLIVRPGSVNFIQIPLAANIISRITMTMISMPTFGTKFRISR